MLPLIIPISGVIAVLVTVYLIWDVRRQETGTPAMQAIAGAIREGAFAFLGRQYRTIGILSVVVAVLLYFTQGHEKGLATAVSFLAGAFASALSGYIGMWTAVTGNLRVAAGAQHSLNRALQIAFRSGAVTGLAVTTLSLLGVWGLFEAFQAITSTQQAPLLIVGFGFGASFVALFAQLGGGIYTKAADVGADLVGKVEAGIPEDDPRNPAVIADLVGDNVGDCAGRGADLFESTAAENIGAMILGIALIPQFGLNGILFPLVARAFGLLASIIGIFTVRAKEDEDPMSALNRGYLVTSVLIAIALFFVTRSMLGANSIYLWAAAMVGLLLSLSVVWVTQYYTEFKYRPVQEIARASITGPATNIISGIAVGFESTAIPVIMISIAIYAAYRLGLLALPGVENAGLYGTAVATMGMLSTVTYILAMDTYGPITDNAGGIVEMSGAPKEIRDRTDKLDASGNTTKALTKGFAVGSAALAAFLLFSAYTDEIRILTGKNLVVDIGKPEVFIGAFIGAMLVFLFSAAAIKAVGRAAQYVIQNVRDQFKANPGIMEGTSKPDYGQCVDIVTKGALKEMVLPGVLVVATPVIVGYFLKAEAVGGFLMVSTIVGVIMALFLNTGGGAWDNAKKYVETGAHGGKRSEPHKAAVVGDTVGDPFKDTAGPSLHVLIKLLSTITLVLAALFV
ncbi:MAG TPA: sodium-translocating pyrophosphatase [Symbiobacteriaceae bacterium]|nr:sodium-translocating pyrophosphatase [Symbiobacteriaceae bacterium]